LPGGLAFASRADVLLQHAAINPSLDQQAIYDYFYSHMIPSPRTIFSGIQKLQPGECLVYEKGSIETRFYWDIPYAEEDAPVAQLEEQLHSLLQDAVQRNIDSEATGAFLSGGLDSSTVTGYFARLHPASADVYGIGFDAEGYDEMAFARATAKHFGARLHEYYVTPEDVADAVPKIAQAYDEPFGNSSAVPAFYCAKLAKEDGKDCLLAGDGGDEIFGGNARYATQKIFALYERIPSVLKKGLIEPVAFKTPGAEKIAPLRKLGSYVRQANIPMPERLETYNFLHRTPIEQIFTEQCLAGVDPRAPINHLNAFYERAKSDHLLKRMLHLDAKITLADNDLRKVSRTCDQAGIDVRYPMIDERLVEFAARVPCSRLLKGYELRSFYRRAMKDFLAPETLAKSKQGFGLPFGVWMQHDKQLKQLSGDSLQSFRQRDILRQDYIDTLLEAHRSEHAGYYGVMIWVVMMLEQWLSSHQQ
jgi:asparagine synthase (glutamine-hydrolysing)